jgi:hypothetical protein
MSNENSLLEAKKRFKEINADIVKMMSDLNEAHKKSLAQPLAKDFNWGDVGDAARIAKGIEEVLIVFGALDESKTKYSS